jgi:hypothetical protein
VTSFNQFNSLRSIELIQPFLQTLNQSIQNVRSSIFTRTVPVSVTIKLAEQRHQQIIIIKTVTITQKTDKQEQEQEQE